MALSRGLSRRRLLTVGTAGAAGALLAACGGPGGGGSGGQQTGGQGAIGGVSGKIIWQAREGQTYRQLAEWAVGEFKKKYPNATVEISQEATGNFDKTVTTLVAGTGPDTCTAGAA